MNLYRDIKTGVFSGTQAIAKSIGPFVPVEVPVDKAGLIEYLNDSLPPAPSGLESEQELTPEPKRTVGNGSVVRNDYPPRDTLVGRCNMVELKELSTMMNVLINRTWNDMDRLEDKS
jgi:hypothetical protein